MSNLGNYVRVPKLVADNAVLPIVRNAPKVLHPVPPLVPLTGNQSQNTSRKPNVNHARYSDSKRFFSPPYKLLTGDYLIVAVRHNWVPPIRSRPFGYRRFGPGELGPGIIRLLVNKEFFH